MRAYLSVDPGIAGGMCLLLGGEPVEYSAMPSTAKGVKDWLEAAIVAAGGELAMVVEYQSPMPGKKGTPFVNVKATANMMRKFGQWEIFALMLGLPYHEVVPSKWKKAMGVTADKATSIELCERLFPAVDLILPRCRVKHDGIAEAILIGEWARRAGL